MKITPERAEQMLKVLWKGADVRVSGGMLELFDSEATVIDTNRPHASAIGASALLSILRKLAQMPDGRYSVEWCEAEAFAYPIHEEDCARNKTLDKDSG